jgi:hypothetical protein
MTSHRTTTGRFDYFARAVEFLVDKVTSDRGERRKVDFSAIILLLEGVVTKILQDFPPDGIRFMNDNGIRVFERLVRQRCYVHSPQHNLYPLGTQMVSNEVRAWDMVGLPHDQSQIARLSVGHGFIGAINETDMSKRIL